MLTLFGTTSPNVLKIVLMLEEIELPYKFEYVALMKGEGLSPPFLALNPFGKVPVITDETEFGPQTIFESGAILIYLAETYAPALLPKTGPQRWEIMKWLVAQVAFAGPMLGQLNHFQLIPSEAHSYAAGRYKDQARRVYSVFNDRLASAPWLGGATYSVADIAMYPWTAYLSRHGFDETEFPHLANWRARIDARPAWARAQGAIARINQAGEDKAAHVDVTEADMDRFLTRFSPGPKADVQAYFELGPMIRGAKTSP